MTTDVIALTPTMPDPLTVLAGLYAGGPGLTVGTACDGAVIQLCTAGGRPLVSIEAPLLLQVPGEVRRLLGSAAPRTEGPVWWTEARASTARPEAAALAASFAGRLAAVLDGTVHPPQAARTDVVAVPDDLTAVTGDEEAQPIVDVLSDSTAVVLTDRPVLPLTGWLAGIRRVTAANGLALHLVTPPATRLTLPLRSALTGLPNRWIIQESDTGYHDALSGAVLQWRDGTFGPVRTDEGATRVAAACAAPPPDTGERQLVVTYRTLHPAAEELLLGQSLEAAWRHLTGEPPTGWSTAEPVNLPWSPARLTELARDRSPKPTTLTAVGAPDRPALATVRVTPTTDGVEEDTTLALGYAPAETPPLAALEPLAAELSAHHGLVTLLTALRPGRRDLTVAAGPEVPPHPVALTLGPAAIRETGLDQALHLPVAVRPVRVGPGVHYVLGDGTDPDAWEPLQRLLLHLRRRHGVRP